MSKNMMPQQLEDAAIRLKRNNSERSRGRHNDIKNEKTSGQKVPCGKMMIRRHLVPDKEIEGPCNVIIEDVEKL
ncbi:hypothetical protein QYF36_020409 [Acer negundo]|nr:hypothetical protein QYF36_020409 [Acer negundo]